MEIFGVKDILFGAGVIGVSLFAIFIIGLFIFMVLSILVKILLMFI
ncbi:hypothetical protein [Methanobacterium paludis]|uniref:Uncharacterized protein n=1 Tax=Methanobacterium paludis (strain DSM 25820 / JCM 18151 / SWAN1) TaxID=868131 RepID=F6D2A6_METPW|nr:hypothetical protein [Methanobacterium paludis]AEG18623.1 hypothetical protein MSWAN_1612 [Methanobacterium paludis]